MIDYRANGVTKAGVALRWNHFRPIYPLAFLSASNQALAEWDGRGFHADGHSGSVFVLLLGALHALPILFIAYKTHSKALTIVTAILMAAIGVALGGDNYALIDLFFVALGTYGAFQLHIPAEGKIYRRPVGVHDNQPHVPIKAKQEFSVGSSEYQLGIMERTKNAYETAKNNAKDKRIQDVRTRSIERARLRGFHLVFDDAPLSDEDAKAIETAGLKVIHVSVPSPTSSLK